MFALFAQLRLDIAIFTVCFAKGPVAKCLLVEVVLFCFEVF